MHIMTLIFILILIFHSPIQRETSTSHPLYSEDSIHLRNTPITQVYG